MCPYWCFLNIFAISSCASGHKRNFLLSIFTCHSRKSQSRFHSQALPLYFPPLSLIKFPSLLSLFIFISTTYICISFSLSHCFSLSHLSLSYLSCYFYLCLSAYYSTFFSLLYLTVFFLYLCLYHPCTHTRFRRQSYKIRLHVDFKKAKLSVFYLNFN